MPGEMVHFDIPVDDVDKAIDFYGYVMGWKFDKYGSGGDGGGHGRHGVLADQPGPGQ